LLRWQHTLLQGQIKIKHAVLLGLIEPPLYPASYFLKTPHPMAHRFWVFTKSKITLSEAEMGDHLRQYHFELPVLAIHLAALANKNQTCGSPWVN
jgi:hypothetical protein